MGVLLVARRLLLVWSRLVGRRTISTREMPRLKALDSLTAKEQLKNCSILAFQDEESKQEETTVTYA